MCYDDDYDIKICESTIKYVFKKEPIMFLTINEKSLFEKYMNKYMKIYKI